MAVVTLYSTARKQDGTYTALLGAQTQGASKVISVEAVTVTSGDSANSKIYLGKMPSGAIPDLSSLLYHDALTGVSDFDIGLELNGTTVDIDVFADGLTLASAGSKSVFAAVGTANVGKPVWKLLGLTSDPGKIYDVVATLKAAASATGVISAQIKFVK